MLFLLLFLFSPASFSYADNPDTIVVTANRIETPEDEVASSVTVIGPEEITRKARDQVSELLRDVPGLTVESEGGPGQPSSVFIRGSDSDHVLVLIDGVEANDPLSPGRAYDFGNLSTADIERIEVVRGSQSVLYGSEAIGGVINIITKKGHPGGVQADFQEEYGTYETYRLSGSVRGGAQLAAGDRPRVDYAVGVTQSGTQGFPAADAHLGNVVNTGQSQLTLSGNAGYEPEPGTRVDAMIRYSNSSFGLAASGGPPGFAPGYPIDYRTGDDPGSQGTDREVYGKLEATRKLTEFWQAELAFHYTGDQRTTLLNEAGETLATPPEPVYGEYDEYGSQRLRGVFQNNFYLTDKDTLTAGLELARESGDSTEIASAGAPDTGLKGESDRLEAGFIQDQWLSDAFFATAGLRYDTYRNIGSATTYRLAPGTRIAATGTTFKGSLGTGFKIPSLYQRYSSFGDPTLAPERSVSVDAGFEQELGSRDITFGMTYFHADFNQLIDYDFATQHYFNVGQATSYGVETEAKAKLGTVLLALAYTYTLARDDLTGKELPHRPKQAVSTEVSWKVSGRAELGAQGRFVGARADADPVTFAPVEMPSYAVFYLNAHYHIAKGLDLFARIDNLLDRWYEEVDGYGTAGRSVFVGMSEAI